METQWIIFIAVVLVCAVAFVLYLVKWDQKDKDDVIRFFNETETEDRPEPKDEDEI